MMESLETGSCLWVVTDQDIFGFRVDKLEQLGKNSVWHSRSNLSQLPFDFHLKLPDRNLHPFFLDSKLFFAGGSFDSSPLSSNEIYQLSYAGGTTLDIAEVEAAGTVPEPPTLLYNCYVTNIQGEVHLMVHDAMIDDRKMGFWVLRSVSGSGSKQWHPLPLPPTLRNYDPNAAEVPKRDSVRHRYWECFTWKDKLLLIATSDPAKRKSPNDFFNYYVYNPQHGPQDDPWQQKEDPFSCFSNGYCPAIGAVPSLGNVGNCNVALAWSTEAFPPEYLKLKIYALLVDNDDNCVRHQCLDELSDVIPSHFIRLNALNVKFVDLGEGKVCVLVGGNIADLRKANAVLCVLVLKLSLVQEEEEAQRFLSVDFLVNKVYDMEPFTKDWAQVPQSSFVFSVSKGMPFKHPHSQGSNSPRKEPKLASGTSPSNPRTLLE